MTQNPVIVFVRSKTDLHRACGEISDFLSARHRINPALSPEEVLGIWIDEYLTITPPATLEIPADATGPVTASIRETVGIGGIWNLCWLNLDPEPGAGYRLWRSDVAETLLAVSPPQPTPSSLAFVPVFSHDAPGDETDAEMERLTRCHPWLVLAPIYWEAGHERLEITGRRQRDPDVRH